MKNRLKLQLKKEIIACLSNEKMNELKGGLLGKQCLTKNFDKSKECPSKQDSICVCTPRSVTCSQVKSCNSVASCDCYPESYTCNCPEMMKPVF